MPKLSKLIIFVVLSAASCICFSGCASLAEGFFGSLFMSKKDIHEEVQRNHENPNRLIEKIEADRRSETLNDIQKQNQQEEAVRAKKINDLLEMQFQNQRSPKP